jgi:Flp pilus assembly protein TadD
VRAAPEPAPRPICHAPHRNKDQGDNPLHLAQVLLLLRDGPQALEWLETARRIDPESLRIEETYGDALARVGAQSEARLAWLTAARIDPGDIRGVRGLVVREVRQAMTAVKGRKLVMAEKYFRRAALLEPKSWAAMTGLSNVLLDLGDVGPAVTWAERAVAVVPRNSAVRLVLGDALARAGDEERAIASWREASLLDPTNREARKRLNRVH